MIAATIRVNGTHVAEIKAQKNEAFKGVETYHTYEYSVRQHSIPEDPIQARDKMRDPGEPLETTGIVQHRYKDGAVALVAKILEDAGKSI